MAEEVSAARAAILTDRNERTIRRHIADGSLVARKTHRGWRISVEELQRRYGPAASDRPVLVQLPVQRHKEVKEEAKFIVQDDTTSEAFHNHAEAARWLVTHGIESEHTPKSWRNWMACDLTKRAILAFALRLQDPENWRIRWRLSRCGLIGCVCTEMLEA